MVSHVNAVDPATVRDLIAETQAGTLSRRELLTRATAVGLSAPLLAALAGAPAGSQEPVTLSFDAGATGGGGGKPNATLLEYCRIIDGGSQFELDRMVDVRLVTLGADLNSFVGELAESWEIADTTATFKLLPNATWHDGQPLTAKDVVFTFNTLTNPASKSRWGASFKSVVGYAEMQAGSVTSLSGVTAPDDLTVVVELTQPDSGLLPGLIFVSILPEHIFKDVDLTKICEASNWTEGRIGAGPFKFVQLVEGERIELEAFDGYRPRPTARSTSSTCSSSPASKPRWRPSSRGRTSPRR